MSPVHVAGPTKWRVGDNRLARLLGEISMTPLRLITSKAGLNYTPLVSLGPIIRPYSYGLSIPIR